MLRFFHSIRIFEKLGSEAQAESPMWKYNTGKIPRYTAKWQWIYTGKGIFSHLYTVYAELWGKVMTN